ncbi:MAG TPA: hypothetical protein VMU83_05715 [Hanamia sp.]|nr:hypothetical protein [Hanamia sp.]
MIKKYGTGLLAIIIAVGAFAFTTPVNKNLGTKLFRYSAPGGSYSQPNVQDNGNWVLITGSANCPSNVNQRACEMDVDDSQLNPDNSLKSSFSISAQQYGSTGVFYVNGISSGTIHNKTF